jgi:tetratricopeptide (TPR) repeat protein
MSESYLRGLRRGVLFACAGLWGACTPPQPLPLQVEYAGCAEVFLPGPVCALGEKKRQMRFWAAGTGIEVWVDGQRQESASVAVAEGQQLTVKVPSGASEIEVRSDTPRGEAAWSLKLAAAPRWPSLLTNAYQLQNDGKPADALFLLKNGIPRLPLEKRWLALRLRAQIAKDQVAYEQAVAFFEEAISAEHAAGALLAEANDATVLVWIHIQARQFDAARKVLSGLQLPAGSPAEAVYYRSLYTGMLAENYGDARSALAGLEQAVEQKKRVSLDIDGWAAEQVLARQLQVLGRSREAAALFARLHHAPPEGLDPCHWAEMLSNHAWSLLLAGEAGEAGDSVYDPISLLAEAKQSYERESCPPLEEKLLNLHLNLTLAHLQDERPAEARASLSEARALEHFATPLHRLWSLELEARLDLSEGHPKTALALYERLEELAASVLSPDGRWRAAYGRARCYRAMGHSADALATFRKAEVLLDQQSLQIPIQKGRETFAAQHEGATKLFLELLLTGHHDAEAFDVARRARSRVLRQLARGNRLAHLPAADRERWYSEISEYQKQRHALDANIADDWKLPADQLSRLRAARAAQYRDTEHALDRAFTVLGEADESEDLPPLRSGEVVLDYHPLPRGWVGFAANGRTVVVHRFELPESVLARPAALAERLLAPFHAQIEQAQRVRVLPYGILRTVDFHALPFGADILLAAHPVVYGLDVATQAESLPRPGRRALVVANPRSDLPAADVEAGEVMAALHRQEPAWSTTTLQGTEATAEALRRGLPRVDLLHYAGHGIFSGFGGWESVLPLADGSQLALGDVLALDGVPPWVVLSGCETARSGNEAPAEGLSLAHAFLLAGSRSVIAATRPVGDLAAKGLFTELYRRWGSSPDLAVQLQQAQLAWRQRDPDADWPSFRLFEP